MRILYFYQYFTTPRGSWSTRVYELARRWVAAGHDVTVITSVYDKSDLRPKRFLDRVRIEGIDVRVINVGLSNKHGAIRRVVTFLGYALAASWYALTLPADVVVASSGPITVGIPGLVAHWVRRRPFVFEVRDLWPEGAIQLGVLRGQAAIAASRLLERTLYHAASVIVAASPGMARHIEQLSRATPVVEVPNAADMELFGKATPVELPEWASGKRLALYTGTLGLIDNCGQLLAAASELIRLGRDDILVVLIGDGRERTELEIAAASQNLRNVHFLGLLPKTEVARWVRAATCMLIPVLPVSFLDTASPNKLFDALAAGVPVIQTTQGWIRALLERRGCGTTVPPRDPHAMARAVIRLVDEPLLCSEMSARAREVACELFDRDLLAGKMLDALRQAAGSAA